VPAMMKMMKMMKIKNNKIIVSTIVGIVVVALIGGYFLFMQPKKNGVNSIFREKWGQLYFLFLTKHGDSYF